MPSTTPSQAPGEGPTRKSLSAIPKSWTFTSRLPPDPLFPTPLSSHQTPREHILPRTVRGALYTFVRPAVAKDPELLGVSAAALRDLGIAEAEAKTDGFLQTVAGNRLWEWDEAEAVAEKEKYKKPDSGEYDEQRYRVEAKKSGYPWAQCYGGYQFGQWAGQLGDGRAISLFETTPPPPAQDSKTRQNDYRPDDVPLRYELQLKGAGLTPYSRFADGKAVLRSSIREWIVSEYLHALGIPTTRALSLTLLPHERVHRETIEPGAIVLRFAQSWIRFGTFDLPRARGDRDLLRKLANYVAEEVFGGWEFLPPRVPDAKGTEAPSEANIVPGGECNGNERARVGKFELQGPVGMEENRYTRLYREIARRNARTVARWQAYGFMNGVLNTDNTSIYGLSIDFGPFAFMDAFDPKYTPNHDDHLLRYCFRNQPTVIWWNLVRLGEALGELMGAGPEVDEKAFVDSGVESEEAATPLIKRAEGLIERCGEEYKAVFMAEYKQVMSKRLGLRTRKEEDFEVLFSELLDWMEELEADFHLTFRRLSELKIKDLETGEQREEKAGVFFNPEGITGVTREREARKRIGEWLGRWRERIVEDWGKDGMVDEGTEEERIKEMKKVNPSFVPRGWVLDEIIRRVQHEGERDVLRRVMHMAVHPFEDTWNGKTFEEEQYEGDEEEEKKWTGDVPRSERGMMCSCSS